MLFYSLIGVALLRFVVSCFGFFGPAGVRCLFSLADLALLQYESSIARQALPPLVSYADFCAHWSCYRQGFSYASSLQQPFAQISALARNCHGPAGSFSSPTLPTYASSLDSLPLIPRPHYFQLLLCDLFLFAFFLRLG